MSVPPDFDPKVRTPRTVYTATKAVWAAGVVLLGAVAFFVKAVADGDLSLDEGLEVLGMLVGVPGAYTAVYRAENRPKAHRA